MKFDIKKLSQNDLNEINEAVKRTGERIRFWYKLNNALPFFINEEEIIEQTIAVSDYDKLHHKYESMTREYDSDSESFHLSNIKERAKGWRGLLGFKNLELCVHNPENPLIYLEMKTKKAKLIQIDGLSYCNTFEGRVNFEKGFAVINEEDQDLAHKLGLIFSPAGILEVDCLSPSEPEMHKNKSEEIIYCDNRGCKKEIRNPILVVDDKTGGIYHSEICYLKDIGIKRYLGIEGCFPREVSLSKAKEMLKDGFLQQSPNFKLSQVKLRSLEEWPEAVIVLRH